MGDHQDLAFVAGAGARRPAQGGQRLAYRHRRLAADAGVDLVEHQRGRSLGLHRVQHQPGGQHGPGQLAARRHLGQRQHRFAGIGAEQVGHLVSRVGVGHNHCETSPGQRQFPEPLLDGLGQGRRRLAAVGPDRRFGLGHGRGGGGPFGLQPAGGGLVALQLGQPGRGLPGVGDDLVEDLQ